MHKELLVLGLLHFGPRTGYDLHRIVATHGDLYADLKQGNLYYLLERLAAGGALVVTTQPGARGPRRARLIYTLTDGGRERFHALLREVVRTYEVAHTGIEVGMVFLAHLATAEAIELLEERRAAVLERRTLAARALDAATRLHEQLAQDHLLSLMDAELAWIARAIERLRQRQRDPTANEHEHADHGTHSAPPCADMPSAQ